MLELFRLARWHAIPLPPAGGRTSVIAVEDRARLLVMLPASNALIRAIVEPVDGHPEGWDHRELARAIGAAVGKPVLPLPLPRVVLQAVSRLDRLFRGKTAKLTAGPVR